MKIEQIYTGCLSQGAYYIESQGEVAIIDPLRDVSTYIQRAERDKASIKYILETHFHADFVSGHLELAEKTGAEIVFGPTANTSFEARIVKDEEVLKLGAIEIKVLHTPGHTLESSCYLLVDEEGEETALFSGDTLFLGDVGRPDLAQKGKDITESDLAGMLYDSLRNKIMPLSDGIMVYPAHGAGSACGKHMSKDTVDSLGNQKASNYALRADMTKEEFVKEVTHGLLPPPGYFPMNVRMNKEGVLSLDEVKLNGTRALDPDAFEYIVNAEGALVLDVRSADNFALGHIPNSIFIGIDGGFAPWVGELIKDVKHPILLVAEEDRIEEVITRLSRVGFDYTLGYLTGGINAWTASGKVVSDVSCVEPEFLTQDYDTVKNIVFDVRKVGEYESEHLIGVKNTPLSFINDYLNAFPKDKAFYLHCAGGYRSMIAASMLKAKGFESVININKGFKGIKEAALPLTEYVCPSTL
jgi:glyoxylase-like metal-dependent hydrolase (beta-lactamase superfamily II)/rhodanese-related sulfurtransferase